MKNLIYKGLAFKNREEVDTEITLSPDLIRQNSVVDGLLYVSEKELIKYRDSRFIILLDGVIYKFREEVFNEDHYENLAVSFMDNVEDTLSLLDGEFTLFLADRLENIFYIAVSESGNAALYYHENDRELLFSNYLDGFPGEIQDSNSLNYERIYQILSGRDLGSENTIYKGIRKLLPGNYLTFSKEEVKIREYSTIFEIKRASQVKAREVYEKFYEIFKSSVQKRIRSERAGIALSSGKDSVSVAAMLASISGKELDLFSYTSKPAYFQDGYKDYYSYDETILLRYLFKRYSQIHSREIRVTQQGYLIGSLEQSLEIHGEPVYGASNQYWILEMHRMLLQDQCKQLFTGQGGNFTISWPPPELAFRKRGFKSIIKRLINSRKGQFHKLPYLSNEFLSGIHYANPDGQSENKNIHDLQPIFLKNSIGYTGFLQKQVSLSTGIFVTDPTVDKELIKFCLSLPYEVYHDKQNSRKLVSIGLRNIIPEAILQNRIRGIQSSDIQFRIEMEREQLFEKLVFFSKNKIVKFVFEIDRLIREWEKFDFFKMNRRDINHILRIFSVAMFLSKIEDELK